MPTPASVASDSLPPPFPLHIFPLLFLNGCTPRFFAGQNNALVLLSCLCDILACFIEELAGVADLIDFIADIVTAIVSSVPPTTAEYTSTLTAISAQVTQARACRSGLT